jgi:cytochrome c553
MRKLVLVALAVIVSFVVFAAESQVDEKSAQDKQVGQEGQAPPPPPPARKIPAINADDQFPRACVDCHLNYTDMNMDTRLSTLMAEWQKEVHPKLLAMAQAAAPEGMTLKGKHPVVGDPAKNIPKNCLTCHARGSKIAPPFAVMLHEIHLTGGDENHFMTIFQGECTHCHKLNLKTGQWTIPSGAEK